MEDFDSVKKNQMLLGALQGCEQDGVVGARVEEESWAD
jgi:hypothetical protein